MRYRPNSGRYYIQVGPYSSDVITDTAVLHFIENIYYNYCYIDVELITLHH